MWVGDCCVAALFDALLCLPLWFLCVTSQPGSINFEADVELVLKCILMQHKAERVVRLLASIGPLLPASIGPEKMMDWFLRSEARGTEQIVQASLLGLVALLVGMCLCRLQASK